MFALIISIIAIALVVALAGATLYYGGDAFTQGTARSTAAALVNQGQQISAAYTLFESDNGGAAPAAIGDLVTGEYLAAVPTSPVNGNGWVFGTNAATEVIATPDAGVISAEVCDAVNALPGNGGVFVCVEGATAAENTFEYKL